MVCEHANDFIVMLPKIFIYITFKMPIAPAPIDEVKHLVVYSPGTVHEIQAIAKSILVEKLMICTLWE